MSLNGIGETAREIFQVQNLSDEESWQELIDIYRGNPYYLKTLCRMIQEIFNCKVRDYLAYNSLFLGDEIMISLDQHFQRLSSLEKQVISQLSQMDKPVTLTEIFEKLSLSPPQVLKTIQSLGRRSLIEKITQEELTLFTVSPVIREYLRLSNETTTTEQ